MNMSVAVLKTKLRTQIRQELETWATRLFAKAIWSFRTWASWRVSSLSPLVSLFRSVKPQKILIIHTQVAPNHIGLSLPLKVCHGTRTKMSVKRSLCFHWMDLSCVTLSRALCHVATPLPCSIQMAVTSTKTTSNWNCHAKVWTKLIHGRHHSCVPVSIRKKKSTQRTVKR